MGGLAVGASAFGVYNKLLASPPNGAELTIDTTRTPTYCESVFGSVPAGYTRKKKGRSGK